MLLNEMKKAKHAIFIQDSCLNVWMLAIDKKTLSQNQQGSFNIHFIKEKHSFAEIVLSYETIFFLITIL